MEASETPAGPPEPPEPTEPRPPAGRLLPGLCVAIATVLLFFGSFAIWANRQLLNTDNWVSTSTKLLENKDVQAALGPYLVNELFKQVNVQAELQAKLPPQLQPLAGPAAGGLRQLAEQASVKLLASPQVDGVWQQVNRAAHKELLKLLEGGGNALSTSNGEVTLHLKPIVAQIASQVGLPSAVAGKIPNSAANLVILRSNQLKAAQDAAQIFKGLVIVLTLLVIGLYVLAMVLARGRRRGTLLAIGWGFVGVGALVLVARSLAGNEVVNDLVKARANLPAGQATWSIATDLLRQIGTAQIFFGVLVLLAGWLAGESRPALAFRRFVAPALRDHPVPVYLGALVVGIVIVAWHPLDFARVTFTAILFLVLVLAAVAALRHQTAQEFPAALEESGAGGEAATSG